MSRSYRKPYRAVTGQNSAHHDKKQAARGVRRKQNQWVRTTEDFEDALIPHRLECACNNTYGWVRDGSQRYQHLDRWERDQYERCQAGDFTGKWDESWTKRNYSTWPPLWYRDLQRK